MDTEGVLTAATFQLAKEDDFIIDFLHGYVVVLDAFEGFLHLVQLMVVGGKQGARLCPGMLVDMLYNSPGNGNTVVGRSTTPQLIKQHKAARRQVIQDIRRLVHLYHKRRFADGDIVAGTHTGKDFIYQADMGTLGRHKTTDLSQQRNQRRLPQQCGFTCHVGTGNDNNLLRITIQHHIIGNVLLTYRKLLLNHRMASLMDFQYIIVGNDGADIVILAGSGSKGKQAVQARYLVGINLNGGDKLAQSLYQFGV